MASHVDARGRWLMLAWLRRSMIDWVAAFDRALDLPGAPAAAPGLRLCLAEPSLGMARARALPP